METNFDQSFPTTGHCGVPDQSSNSPSLQTDLTFTIVPDSADRLRRAFEIILSAPTLGSDPQQIEKDDKNAE